MWKETTSLSRERSLRVSCPMYFYSILWHNWQVLFNTSSNLNYWRIERIPLLGRFWINNLGIGKDSKDLFVALAIRQTSCLSVKNKATNKELSIVIDASLEILSWKHLKLDWTSTCGQFWISCLTVHGAWLQLAPPPALHPFHHHHSCFLWMWICLQHCYTYICYMTQWCCASLHDRSLENESAGKKELKTKVGEKLGRLPKDEVFFSTRRRILSWEGGRAVLGEWSCLHGIWDIRD